MDHESDGADECQLTTSNTNVRVKVSSWVTSFVSEMRTKSPAVVQRWVDSLPNDSSTTDIVPNDIAIKTDNRTDDIASSQSRLDDTGNLRVKNCNSITLNQVELSADDIRKHINELNVNEHTDEEDDGDDNDEVDNGDGEDDDNNKIIQRQASEEIVDCERHKQLNVERADSGGDGGGGGGDDANSERGFWKKGASVLTALRNRSATSIHDSNRKSRTETQDLSASRQFIDSDTHENSSTPIKPLLNKSKFNDIYHKLRINKKRYNFIKDRQMDAKKLLNDAKSRLLAAANWDETHATKTDDQDTPLDNELMSSELDLSKNVENMVISPANTKDETQTTATLVAAPIATTTTATTNEPAGSSTAATVTATIVNGPETSGTTLAVCDTIDMDISCSAEELSSRLSQSNDLLSIDDEDSFNVSMPSIDSHHATHLNVNRRIAMVDIGRSTSDNPRLRRIYLGDIGRSFSEHQDDDTFLIGERNISAPSSSIAIQNNNRSSCNFFERRSYSVSPTQRGLKRGTLSRDQSLSDSSRHRNPLSKGSSFQSDSSHASSVESLLDARKPDSEAILRQLGFGSAHQEDLLSRIPKRFLKPSQVPGIDTEAFMRQQAIANNLHEQSILGYRGLTGDPHVLPSVIVAKIMERFQMSDENNGKFYDVFNDGRPMSAPPTPGPNDLADMRHREL